PALEVVVTDTVSPAELREAVERATGDVVGILAPRVRAASNWLSATVPFLDRSEISAVVTPQVAPPEGPVRARAAAAVSESRVGSGFAYYHVLPGNIRYVQDYPAAGIVIRRSDFLALPVGTPLSEAVARVTAAGGRVLYTPESVLIVEPLPLFVPFLRSVFARGRRR